VISYVAAAGTAVANAASNVLNRKATRDEPAAAEFRLRLIIDLLRRRTWLAAVAMMILSFGLGAAALGTGQLAAVEPIIALELPMTVIGGSWVLGGRLRPRGWAAIAVMTAGLAVLLVSLDPRPGHPARVAAAAWIVGSAANGGGVAVLLAVGWKTRSPSRRAALLGVSCGLGYGLASAYTKGMTEVFSTGGVAAVITSWELYAAMATGTIATWLLQNAYHAGRLATAQPGITLADPVVAVVWGVLAFGEQVRQGVFLVPAVLAVLAVGAAVVVLASSPRMHGAAGQSEAESQRRDTSREAARSAASR
jgi:drug/metabolite transporter (DMT)-like permease